MTVLFVTILVIWILLSLFLFVWFMTANIRSKKSFDDKVYKKLMSLAKNRDYLMFNNVKNNDEFGNEYEFKYMIMADKFCYAINELNVNGAISGININDNFFSNIDLKNKRISIDNFYKTTKKMAKGLDSYLQQRDITDNCYIIPITVVPNSTSIDPVLKCEHDNSYLFKLKDLKKGIISIEDKTNVGPVRKDVAEAYRKTLISLSSVEDKK